VPVFSRGRTCRNMQLLGQHLQHMRL
jgi:hypothetical protein